MFVKKLDRASAIVEYGIPTQRTFPWQGVVEPPFGSMWGLLSPGMQTDLDVHDECETVVIAQGKGQLTVGEETRPVDAGDIVFIPPGITHTLANDSDGELVALFVFWDQPVTAG
jgi:mannose-6-phosphate isomerase-like protein (cupin superfamily)